jgi:hypothetical protein
MKALLAVIVLAGLGYIAYAKVIAPSPTRACDRMADLCGQKLEPNDRTQCVQLFEGIQKNDADDKSVKCVLDAKTCAEAIGCTAGGATKVGITAAGQFLEGFSKSVK